MSLGMQLKERGQQRALYGAGDTWVAEATAEFRLYLNHLKFTGKTEFRMEEFRAWFEQRNSELDMPRPQVWGGFASGLVKSGLIQDSGKWECAKSPRTHGHRVVVYEVVAK